MTYLRRLANTTLAAMLLMVAGFWTSSADAQSYLIRGGDVLSIEVLEDPSLSREVLVLPDGRFSFPFAGTVPAGGRTTEQVAANLRSGIASNFATPPNVFVSVRTLTPQSDEGPDGNTRMNVYFLGEVNAPGPKEVLEGATLLQVLSQGGGFTNFAALKRVQLRRTDPFTHVQTVSIINYKAIADGGVLARDVVLAEGDVIIVPQRRLFE